MTRKEKIINKLASGREIEKLVKSIGKDTEEADDLMDLAQDLYINLLEKPEEWWDDRGFDDEKNLKNYLIRMVVNNIYSSNSTYYRIYKKCKNNYVYNDNYEDGEEQMEEKDIYD